MILELVLQTNTHDVVSAATRCFGVAVVVQQVDFVVNIGRHVFVEVVVSTNFYIFNQVSIAASVGRTVVGETVQALTFRLQVCDRWAQTEIELVLSNNFEVLSFVSNCIRVTVIGGVT